MYRGEEELVAIHNAHELNVTRSLLLLLLDKLVDGLKHLRSIRARGLIEHRNHTIVAIYRRGKGVSLVAELDVGDILKAQYLARR